jgi:adenosine 3'-phospho 5'-phosphosulfate transporter B3
MMCGVLVIHQRYNMVQYLSAILVSGGLALFTLADNRISPEFNVYGVILALLSVFADAILSNLQQKILQSYQSTQSEMVRLSKDRQCSIKKKCRFFTLTWLAWCKLQQSQ